MCLTLERPYDGTARASAASMGAVPKGPGQDRIEPKYTHGLMWLAHGRAASVDGDSRSTIAERGLAIRQTAALFSGFLISWSRLDQVDRVNRDRRHAVGMIGVQSCRRRAVRRGDDRHPARRARDLRCRQPRAVGLSGFQVVGSGEDLSRPPWLRTLPSRWAAVIEGKRVVTIHSNAEGIPAETPAAKLEDILVRQSLVESNGVFPRARTSPHHARARLGGQGPAAKARSPRQEWGAGGAGYGAGDGSARAGRRHAR